MVLLLFVGVSLTVGAPTIVDYIRYETRCVEFSTLDGVVTRGWLKKRRFSGDGGADEVRLWYVRTGFLSQSGRPDELVTQWNPDGTVRYQSLPSDFPTGGTARIFPPWLEGVTDQATPNAPWILRGWSAEEWWGRFGDPRPLPESGWEF